MTMWVIEVGRGRDVRRQRSSDYGKAQLVSEAMKTGASVADVARRHRICTSLVYRWRRVLLLREGRGGSA